MLSRPYTSLFISGIICGLSFAPVFFLPGVFLTSMLLCAIKKSTTRIEAAKFGYIFGFGFYLATLYWISFGVSVYIEQFWWAIPFALFGLPAFLALFTAIIGVLAWQARDVQYFHFIFCCIWVLIEWTMSWIFTGLPWAVLGYALSVWLALIQFADIVGIFGLSFVAIYVGSSFYDLKNLISSRVVTSILIIISIILYGTFKIKNHPTQYTELSARIIQPSIPQTEKWAPEDFWRNLNLQIELSKGCSDSKEFQPQETPLDDSLNMYHKNQICPNLIVWSEAALVAPYHLKPVFDAIQSIFINDDQVLITGNITDNGESGDHLKIYSSMIGINTASKIFEYHKSHLVPFGEYMPLKDILPLKKITHGLIDYTAGLKEIVKINHLHLAIKPLICYESIFPNEVRVSSKNVDLLVNITNDAWYGNSSGPYQHLEISRMRSIENGIPMIRSGNNGISAFIDPIGRVLNRTSLNEVTIINSFIPQKLPYETLFSKYGMWNLLIGLFLVLILQWINKLLLASRV